MVITEKAICKHCGNEFDLSYLVPKAPFLIPLCERCEEELNKACGGSWTSTIYQSIKDENPYERV